MLVFWFLRCLRQLPDNSIGNLLTDGVNVAATGGDARRDAFVKLWLYPTAEMGARAKAVKVVFLQVNLIFAFVPLHQKLQPA